MLHLSSAGMKQRIVSLRCPRSLILLHPVFFTESDTEDVSFKVGPFFDQNVLTSCSNITDESVASSHAEETAQTLRTRKTIEEPVRSFSTRSPAVSLSAKN